MPETTNSPFRMVHQPRCAACKWTGTHWDTETNADDEILEHVETGQHTRNMERWSGIV